MRQKSIIVHSGARDHYQLAEALHENGHLEKLVTDIYFPDFIAEWFPHIANRRYCKGLPSGKVRLSASAFISDARMHLNKSFSLNAEKDYHLSKFAYELAREASCHLFCYSYYAGYAFSKPAAFDGQKKLLFQLHPHPHSVKSLLAEELLNVPNARDSILYENEFRYPNSYLEGLAGESKMADKIIVASSYTAKTLIENGVHAEKISVVPYGIAGDMFKTRSVQPATSRLRIIFIGSMVQRKGLSYLLDASRAIKSRKLELVLCGRGFIDEALIKSYDDVVITVKRNLDHQSLLKELHSSDLFILPTLSEGFAHVVLEAMSSGLPVITTEHSCGPDIITDGKDGWIVPIRSSEAIIEKLEWCLENKQVLFEMGQAAAKTAAKFTWARFRNSVNQFYRSAIIDE